MTRTLTLLFGLSLTSLSFGQADVPFHCGADELSRISEAAKSQPGFMERVAQSTAELDEFTRTFAESGARGGDGYVIPVVFHIIHNNGPENISDAQIFDAMRVLNEDFNKQNADWDNVRPEFLDIVGDIGIEFRLATKDPSGNCTNGITRTVSTLTNDGTETMKALIVWPRNKYLNVWVAASANGAAGYTFRPGAAQWIPAEDGIVLQHTYTGSIGTSSPSRSRTLTHEVGHWFNLPHTWGDGNTPELPSNCNQDDGVADTPNTVGWTTCNLSGTSCGSLDNVENYMDYSYCSKMFTNGQGTRMIASLNSGTAQRNQLWQTSNLINTGVNGNATLCAASFISSSTNICAGSTVVFTDQSYHNVSTRTWSFPGGTPSSSTEANPTITYTESGTYNVTLTVSDGSSNVSTTEIGLVVVAANPGQNAPLIEGFETAGTPADIGWMVENPNDDNTFSITNVAAYSGSNSLRLVNTAGMNGRLDQFISPTIDLSDASAVTFTFRYAFARRNASSDDRLRVYVSNNCGETWSLRRQLFGASNLPTAANTTSSFVPASADDWELSEITAISSNFHVPDFRVRFEFESNGGNNLYLDDININGQPVGIAEVISGQGPSLVVYPNPASGSAQTLINVATAGRVQVELLDVLGRTVTELHNGQLPSGTRTLDLPIAGLPAGLYFVRMQQAGRSEAVRFVVQ